MPETAQERLFDREEVPDEYPAPDWTPKQQENWERVGQDVYGRLETELGRRAYRHVWRPKKRGDGMMQREHVKLGTKEDYVAEMVDDVFSPWGSMTGVMMRKISFGEETRERLEEAVSDIVQAKLERLKERDPAAAQRLLEETEKVAGLYGL